MDHAHPDKRLLPLTLGAIGVVYGDIGTSPLYTLHEVFGPEAGVPLDAAHIVGAASAVFWNSGQVCAAGTRLFVHESVYEQVVQGVAEVGRSMRLGPGTDPTADLGPLISQKQLDRVSGYIDQGRFRIGEAVSLARRIRDAPMLAQTLVYANALDLATGSPLIYAEELLALSTEQKFPQWFGWGLAHRVLALAAS